MIAFVAACLVSTTADSVDFHRAYKEGETFTYAVSQSDSHMSLSGILAGKVTKAPSDGPALVHLRLTGIKASSGGAPADNERDLSIGIDNWPKNFSPSQDATGPLYFLYLLAATTPDQKVEVGASASWKWAGGDWVPGAPMSISGKLTVTSFSAADHSFQADSNAEIDINGTLAFKVALKGKYDASNGSLLSSAGRMTLGNSSSGWDVNLKAQ